MKIKLKKTQAIILIFLLLTGCRVSDSNVVSDLAETTVEIVSEPVTDVQENQTESNEKDPKAEEDMELQSEIESFLGAGIQYDQAIFQSAERLYSLEELREYPDSLLPVFRNEMYARHGRVFQSEEWVNFFQMFSWYEGIYTAEEFNMSELFNETEQQNLKLILAVEGERSQTGIFSPLTYPRVDGSTATIPLSEQVAADAMGIPVEEARPYILHNKTHSAYVNLIEGKADIIFVTAPSEEELEMAKTAGIELEIYPVVKEAFVFLVNEQNSVKGLTGTQIQQIYSGKMKNWKEAGGADQEIRAYQRPENSGSQSGMLSLVMGDVPMMEAPSDSFAVGMDDLVDVVSQYDNSENAIGYSYYYYVNSMYLQKGIRLLEVDGVEPSPETIKNDSYPYTTAYYAVIKKSEPTDSGARKLLEWILDAGQVSAEKAGYIPLK